ncbi:hypothetical protein RND81_10G134500 [Saponaria officinalis]|uniref:Secreted protein n=1 Tax=Saponaria officinalis TaxID=3572 RepID=A0AAW1I1L6_SAPOF
MIRFLRRLLFSGVLSCSGALPPSSPSFFTVLHRHRLSPSNSIVGRFPASHRRSSVDSLLRLRSTLLLSRFRCA